jgi:hypothetical protein
MRLFKNTPPPTPKPRPDISAPVTGSGRSIASPGSASRPVPPNPTPPAHTRLPQNEYPHNRSVPNTVMFQGSEGKAQLLHLPPGAKLASPMGAPPSAPAEHTAGPGWPANNHFTKKYNDLRKVESEAHHAYQSAPKQDKREFKKAYNQARRETLVFKQRHSRSLGTEADFREQAGKASRAQAKAEHKALAQEAASRPRPPVTPEVPQRDLRPQAGFSKASKAPGLEPIPEHPPEMRFPPGTRTADTTIRQPETTSPFPPRIQLERHVHQLAREERDLGQLAKPGSEDARLHKKYSQYLERYETIMKERSPGVSKSAHRTMDNSRQAEKADLARLKADLAPVETRLKQAEKQVKGLEGEQGALQHRLRVLGAQAKGDLAPVKLSEHISHKGEVSQKATLDTGKPKGLMGLFKRTPEASKLSADQARARLGTVETELAAAKENLKTVEGEKLDILARPRYEPPRFEKADLPSREYLLQSLHDSQPLRRTPFKDPLAKEEARTAARPLPEDPTLAAGPSDLRRSNARHGSVRSESSTQSPLDISRSPSPDLAAMQERLRRLLED